jgi:hypothetical protein
MEVVQSARTASSRASPNALVFENGSYSVPHELAGETVWVRRHGGERPGGRRAAGPSNRGDRCICRCHQSVALTKMWRKALARGKAEDVGPRVKTSLVSDEQRFAPCRGGLRLVVMPAGAHSLGAHYKGIRKVT